jgi:hypothetical protein
MQMQSTLGRAAVAAARVISKIFFPPLASMRRTHAVTVPAGTPHVRSRRN